jgi:hypothetical protein
LSIFNNEFGATKNSVHLPFPVVWTDKIAHFGNTNVPPLGLAFVPPTLDRHVFLTIAIPRTRRAAGPTAGTVLAQEVHLRHFDIFVAFALVRQGGTEGPLEVLLLLQLLHAVIDLLVLTLELGHGLHAGTGSRVHNMFPVAIGSGGKFLPSFDQKNASVAYFALSRLGQFEALHEVFFVLFTVRKSGTARLSLTNTASSR